MTFVPVRPIAAALACLLLAACGGGKVADDSGKTQVLQGAPQGAMVAVVNGESVTQPVFETFAKGLGLDIAQPEQRQQALDRLIETLLLAQTGLTGSEAGADSLQAELALGRMQVLAAHQLNALRGEVQIGEQELRDYYAREVERAGALEYQAQHILYADEATAAAALAEALAPDADFEALIQKHAATALQARDLGWANLTQTPPEFAELLGQLSDGEVAPVVVQTRFGYHVLRRAGSRPYQPPAFEEVRPGIEQQLQQQAVAERVRALRAAAQITAPGASTPTPPAK
ncbi:MAG: peptidyl-prolyl cis-trans isomerase [Xanthomonadales bacterium]|nr:peptidyl-prolyl cis-trans isomerase [Xanthomonadales bacterium]